MARTATANRETKSVRETKKSEPSAAEAPSKPSTVEELDVNQVWIVPGLNPRKDFDPIAMCELADSIKLHGGLLQPIIVRPNAQIGYDLMAGERRFRAVRDHLKWDKIYARIVCCNEELQAAITDDENRQRQQLNPIEAAESLARRLKASGLSQRAFGEKIGMSQAEISNQTRLLQLPEAVQTKVISGEIVPSDARSMVPFCDVPAVVAQVTKTIDNHSQDNQKISGPQFRQALARAIESESRPVSGYFWDKAKSKHLYIKLEVTPEIRRKLDIRECPEVYGNGTQLLAFNIPAWEEAQAAYQAEQEKFEAEEQKDESDDSAEEVERRAERARERMKSNLRHYRMEWLQARIANAIDSMDGGWQFRLLLHFVCTERCEDEVDEIVAILRSHELEPQYIVNLPYSKKLNLYSILAPKKSFPEIVEVMLDLLKYFVKLEVSVDGYNGLTPQFIEQLAKDTEVSFDSWVPDKDFLECFEDDQLVTLAQEWKLKKAPSDRKKLEEFILNQKGLPVPACLLTAVTPEPDDDHENDDDPDFDDSFDDEE